MVHLTTVSSLLLGTAVAHAHPERRAAGVANCTGINAVAPGCASNEVLARRDFFYVGGHYVNSAAGNLTYDQLYVEKITPAAVNQSKPIVFFHGGGTSGVVSAVRIWM